MGLVPCCRICYADGMTKLQSLWQGDLPLDEAFWTWVIGVGVLVNLITSGLSLILIAAERPWEVLFVGYVLSVSYNAVATVGVWRSAARHEGDPDQANLARLVTVAVMSVLTVT